MTYIFPNVYCMYFKSIGLRFLYNIFRIHWRVDSRKSDRCLSRNINPIKACVCAAQKTHAGNSLKNAESSSSFLPGGIALEFPSMTWLVLRFLTKIDRSILRKDRVNGRLISRLFQDGDDDRFDERFFRKIYYF